MRFVWPVLGLFAGYSVMTIGVVAATWLMSALVPSYGRAVAGAPPPLWAAVNLVYSALFLAAGAYVAQWIARGDRPVVPLVMGAAMVAMSLIQFGRGMDAWPTWYRVSLLLLPLPMALAGGILRIRVSAGTP